MQEKSNEDQPKLDGSSGDHDHEIIYHQEDTLHMADNDINLKNVNHRRVTIDKPRVVEQNKHQRTPTQTNVGRFIITQSQTCSPLATPSTPASSLMDFISASQSPFNSKSPLEIKNQWQPHLQH